MERVRADTWFGEVLAHRVLVVVVWSRAWRPVRKPARPDVI